MYQSPTTHGFLQPPPPPVQATRYYQPPPLNNAPNRPQLPSYIPRTPAMDSNAYSGAPHSPSSPFSPHPTHSNAVASSSSSTYRHVQVDSNPSSQYISSGFGYYESNQTASPAALTATVLPSGGEEQHVLIHELSPHEGAQGTQLNIKCDVNFPPTPPASIAGGASPERKPRPAGRALRVVFGSHPVQTQVMMLTNRSTEGGQLCQLSAVVPSWSSTGASALGRGNQIPVYVQVLDGSHAIVETIHSGEFTYSATAKVAPPYTNYQPSMSNPLKRGGDALESNRPAPSQYLHRRILSHGKFEAPPEYSQLQPTYSPNPDAGHFSSPYMATTPTLPSAPLIDTYSPTPVQPNLMRATQIQQPIIPAPASSTYNSITTGSAKAKLDLQGDLETMSKGWTQEEWVNRRRLVQFWRRQEGTTICAAFRPLSQQDYPQAQQSIIISCIFREDKNECFVTSVDAIYLLEALVGTRFTVEEKNRIRRNLEGFRPITVSKNKPDSEDFFKLIMGFPNPKPRNIEKDVKVFPWEILGSALKKIIGKYSASYPFLVNGGMAGPQHVTPHATPVPYSNPTFPGPFPGANGYANPAAIQPSNSAPPLISHSSSDSSNSAYVDTNYSAHMPDTPATGPVGIPSESPSHYRANSNQNGATSSEKYNSGHEYVNYSPTGQSPYTTQAATAYWNTGEGSIGGPYSVSSGDLYDQPQLPHVHETHSRQPSSNDLRVGYPALS